jgi:hypothetical protein
MAEAAVKRKPGRPPKNISSSKLPTSPIISLRNDDSANDDLNVPVISSPPAGSKRKPGRPPKKSSSPKRPASPIVPCPDTDLSDVMSPSKIARLPTIDDITAELIEKYDSIEMNCNAKTMFAKYLDEKFVISGIDPQVIPILNHFTVHIITGPASNLKYIPVVECLVDVVTEYFKSRMSLMKSLAQNIEPIGE